MRTHVRRAGLGALVAAGLFLAILAGMDSKPAAGADDLAKELKSVPYKIVYETFRDDNWELFMVQADGSQPVNLTHSPDVNELYPHVSPDGKKLSFVVDSGKPQTTGRDAYTMNLDGTGRALVGKNTREPCWNPAGTAVVYLAGEFDKFSVLDYATKGIFVYDLATGVHRPHPNKDIFHLYNICCSPDGKWYAATVHAGMGYGHAILAIEADGKKVFDLRIPGCRPDISPDGKKIAWGSDDFTLCTGDLDFSGPQPKVTNRRDVVKSAKPIKTYHIDWSPDGKYVAFARGPITKSLGPVCEIVGVKAPGWDICVADPNATNRWVAITSDGQSNKEPDWVPVKKDTP
jgi:Tol biopolymer transport system component